LVNPSIFHRMQTWSSNMYVVIAVFFEEKRTHLVYFTWVHFFLLWKNESLVKIFVLVFIWMIMIIVDDWSNVFLWFFFDIRVRIAGTSIFIFFFSFFLISKKSVKCPQIWTSIMWVCLFMKVRRAELYDLIFPNTMDRNTFWRSILVFYLPNWGL